MNDTSEKLAQALFELGELTQEKIAEEQQRDPFHQQKIYEKWVKQEDWNLRNQGIPLAVGIEPDDWLEIKTLAAIEQAEEAVWQALTAISHTDQGLNILNATAQSGDWQVNSAAFYRWLNTQGITVPDALDSIMQFVMTVTLKPQQPDPVSTTSGHHETSGTREKILTAAFNIVSKEPNACRDASGLTNGKQLAEMIQAQAVIWFGSNQLPMSVEEVGDFLEQCLE